ncbi:uncharacterized protein TNCV_3631541 [Trichonephila clavipes]|nr:uncharacterized protein TNCV_3631541 [Trichonephila clavipes]
MQLKRIDERYMPYFKAHSKMNTTEASKKKVSHKLWQEFDRHDLVAGVESVETLVRNLMLLAADHVILNHGQVTWTTPELAFPLLATTPHQREDVSALDRFNVHCCPARRVFSGTGLELMTCLP